MAVRDILTVPDPRLKQVSKPVEKVDDALRDLMDDMLESMYAADGIGLAAIQIGEPVRVIVMDLDWGKGERKPRYFVNPEILDASESKLPYEEGCLSLPEHYAEVVRPEAVKIRYLDRENEIRTIEADDILATCIQHEIDHLDGVLFVDHISSLKRNMIIKKLQKFKKQQAAEAAPA